MAADLTEEELRNRVAAALAWAEYDGPEEFTPEQWFGTYGVLSRRHAIQEAEKLIEALELAGLCVTPTATTESTAGEER